MAEKDPENGPSLELPSMFGRRRRRAGEDGATKTAPPLERIGSNEAATTARIKDQDRPDATAVIPVVAHSPAATPAPVPEPTPPLRRATPPEPSGGRRRAATSGPKVPELAASTAVLVVGALIGLLGCVLTFLGLKGCELATGTDSCGGPGLLVLVVILVVMVLAGAVALRTLGVTEPGNVSFLGVGITTVVVLLFFIEQLYEPWMFAVVPMVTAVSYALARWITTRYADDILDDDRGVPHRDIR